LLLQRGAVDRARTVVAKGAAPVRFAPHAEE
jgi:hypothetical protein